MFLQIVMYHNVTASLKHSGGKQYANIVTMR